METDQELTAFIKRTLEGYEEAYIPGAWENFVKKQKKKKRIIFWRFGITLAASIMLGYVGLKVFHVTSHQHTHNGQKQIVKTNSSAHILEKKKTLRGADTASSVVKNRNEDNKLNSVNHKSLNNIPGEDSGAMTYLVVPSENKTSENKQTYFIGSSDTTGKHFETTSLNINSTVSNMTNTIDSIRKESIAWPDVQTNSGDRKTVSASKRKIRFGINLSPGVNSTQTATSFNYSGGVNTDITLFSHFQFSTGLQIEHQSIVNNGSGTDASLPAGQTKADLVNLDLPMNITWKIIVNKSGSYYISGGISSLAYLNEKYNNTSYTQQLAEVRTMSSGIETVTYKVETTKSTTQSTVTSFHTFDIAGRINIIVGLEQHLSANLFLHIEPFIKIPVSGLATQNLKFTTSGISCKISF